MALEEYSKIANDRNKKLNIVELGRKLNTYMENKKKFHDAPGSSYENPVMVNRIERPKRKLKCFSCGKYGHIARECRSKKDVNVLNLDNVNTLTLNLRIEGQIYKTLIDTGQKSIQ